MKKTVLISLILLGNYLSVKSDNLINPGGSSNMSFGVYYYPEQWKQEQWDRDLKKISDLGFKFTHFAEFAWSSIEPQDSVFDFGWLDRCVDLANKYGLKVVMCTPSATPPAWLTEKHPEILVEMSSGKKVKHGMRLNANASNPVYQNYIERIVRKMAERYGRNSTLCGWQIDNEPHFEGLYDYSDFSKKSFQNWLKRKYGDIEKLNETWGGTFWSLSYNDFNQIDIPNPEEHFHNPHAFIDFKRYNADALAAGLEFQYNLLKELIAPSQWVTTNFAYYGFLPSVDPFRSKNNLDFASYTMYPLNTFLEYPEGKEAYRLGSGMELAFQTEIIKSLTGKTGVMELQPGQINWGTWNSIPLPGAVRMWIWHCYGLGDDFVCTYRFRQPLYGAEQFHKGIMEPDGVSLSPGGLEFCKAIKEIEALPAIYEKEPNDISGRRTAFLWKHDNLFSIEHTELRGDWELWKPFLGIYKKLKTMGIRVDFLTEDMNFDVNKYPFMVGPSYEMIDHATAEKLRRYVEEGGNLVLTYRSGLKDNDSHLWEGPQQEPLVSLIGAKVKGFDQLPDNVAGHVKFGEKEYEWNKWGDLLEPGEDTETWAEYSDQFYKGTPAVIYRKLAKGSVCYIGTLSKNFELEEDILRKFYIKAGSKILTLPEYFFVEFRDGYYIAMNYTSNDVKIPEEDKAEIILGETIVPPGGVTVWRNKL